LGRGVTVSFPVYGGGVREADGGGPCPTLAAQSGPQKKGPAEADPFQAERTTLRLALGGLAAVVAVPRARFLHAQVVLHVLHARQRIDQVLGAALLLAARNRAVERDLAARHADLDRARVDPPVLGQLVAGILADALVGAGVAGRAVPAMVLFAPPGRVLVAEPAGDLVARALEEPALGLLAVAPVLAPGRCAVSAFAVIAGAVRSVWSRRAAARAIVSLRPGEVGAAEVAAGEAAEPAAFAVAVVGRAVAALRIAFLSGGC